MAEEPIERPEVPTSPAPAPEVRLPERIEVVLPAPEPAPGLGSLLRGFPLLAAVGVTSVAVSLIVRGVHRGPYYAGCELIAAAVGQFLIATMSFGDMLREIFYQNRNFWLAWPTYPVPFSLIPGYLNAVWPWEHWAQLVTLGAWLLTLLLIARAAELKARDTGIVLLAWGASPMMLSYSIVGEAWASGFLPTAMALWVTMSRKLRDKWLLSLVLCLVANELAWHVYEVGKLVGLVFIVAAFLQRDASLFIRVVWIVAGLLQLVDVLFVHVTANIKAFAFQQGSPFERIAMTSGLIMRGIQTLTHSIVTLDLDLPVVFLLGLVSVVLLKRDRALLLVMLGVQIGLQILLAMYGPENMRPRRFLMVDGYCLVTIACMYRDAGRWLRTATVVILLLGNVWQGKVLRDFTRAPLNVFTLPYMHSLDGVGAVDFPPVQFAEMLRARVDAGEHLLLLYNMSCYYENLTNPAGVLERLYLGLGHDRFVRSVSVFGSEPCRYDCLPIRPLEELDAFLDGVRVDGPTPPATLVGYYPRICKGPGMDGVEVDQMFVKIGQRLSIHVDPPAQPTYLRFTIDGPRKGLAG